MSPRKREEEQAEEYDADFMTEGLTGIIGEKQDQPQVQSQMQRPRQEMPVQPQINLPETPGPEVLEGLEAPPSMDFMEKDGKRARIADVFKSLIPHTDRLLIYKVSSRGRKGLVGEYGAPDLDRSPSIESFVKEYITPTYGPGDYIAEVRGVEGKVKKSGMVNIPSPITPQNNSPTLSEILMAQQTMQKEAEQKSTQQFQNMLSMMTMFKEFMPKGAAGASGGDSSMMAMMVMMMMMNQQQKPSGPDPVTQMLLQKFEQMEKDKFGFGSLHSPVLPPLPPLPPPTLMDSSSSVAEVIKSLVEVIKPISQPQQNNELLAHLITMIAKPDHGSLTLKDVMSLLPTIKEMVAPNRDGASTFNDYLEGLIRLDEIRGSRSGEDHSIWAGLAESVANIFRDIKVQQMRLEALTKSTDTRRGQKHAVGHKIQTAQAARMPAPVPPPTENTENTKQPAPSIPVGFRKFSVRMKDSYLKGDEPALVMAFIQGLLYLRENSQEWAPYIDETMTLAAKGEKKKALKYLEVFLFTFAKNKLITLEVVGATKKTMELNWDMIMEETGLSKALDPDETDDEDNESEEDAAENMGVEDDDDSDENSGEEDEIDPSDIPEQPVAQAADPSETEKPEEAVTE